MKPARWPAVALLVAGASLCFLERHALAQVEFRVTFKDLPAEFKPIEREIEANILAAARMWAERIDARPCTIDILFRLDAGANRGSGRSLTTARFNNERHGGKRVEEQGWASEMRTGKDVNGDEPDVELVFQPAYLRTLWWDPDPAVRKAPVPPDKLDAMTVLLHELGHALAFNGWVDPRTGVNDKEVASTYDRWVTYDGANFFFNGPAAMKLWGGPVPLAGTHNNYHHVCDRPQGPQAKLKDDLMNGVTFANGRRYEIGPMDLAILADCGISLRGGHGKAKQAAVFSDPTSIPYALAAPLSGSLQVTSSSAPLCPAGLVGPADPPNAR
jgi:hypothetical protein